MSDLAPVTHIAGADITIGGQRLRQRCAWCGAVLIDMDLTMVAVQIESGEDPKPPATWPVGSLVRVVGGGGFRGFSALPDTDTLPDDACGRVDDEITR